MWKYIVAALFFIIGSVEMLLAINGKLRETILKTSLVRSRRAEPLLLFLAGLSAMSIGVWILLYR
jgi:hypothetical protein